MGIINLRVVAGTVNFVGYLHVRVTEVLGTGGPGAFVWENWYAMPVSNLAFVVPGLDPKVYIITYYESPDNSSLGTPHMQNFIDAQTGKIVLERRFYYGGGAGANDPAVGSFSITDPYFNGKNITGIFKQGDSYMDPANDYSIDTATDTINILTGIPISEDEKVTVEISYESAPDPGSSGGGSGSGLYNGVFDIDTDTYTIQAGDINKCARLVGSSATQYITWPALSTIGNDDGVYFDNTCGGTAKCVKIFTDPGTPADYIYYDGFASSQVQFTEFWVRKGEKLLLKKYGANRLEVRSDYRGNNVGEIVICGYSGHPGVQAENKALMDGDEEGRLWWWITEVLPVTSKYYSTNVTSGGFTHDANKSGQFCIHPTLKKFRMPGTEGLYLKGLGNFSGLSVETNPSRTVGYPGGIQFGVVGSHTHLIQLNENGAGSQPSSPYSFPAVTDNAAIEKGTARTIPDTVSVKNTVDNSGVIYGRRL